MKIVDMSVKTLNVMGDDLDVVNAARVSFDKRSRYAYETDPKTGDLVLHLSTTDRNLIFYLARHKHWTPFAHCFVSFRIKAPIFVARQLVKHQVGLAWNEVSRRYVDSDPEFYVPKHWRARAENVKQGSSDEPVTLDFDPSGISTKTAFITYKKLLEQGVCPEQARMVLPLNTMTEWVWSGSLAAFARVCKLRLDPHAQSETREIAQLINDKMKLLFPVSWEALMEN